MTTRRKFCKNSIIAGAGLSIVGCTTTSKTPKSKKAPNLLFIYPDEMRGSAMGFLNEEPVKTPVLDKLASESLVLPQAVSNYPVCVPFRTTMMSGKYPFKNGVKVNCFTDKKEMDDSMVWWTDCLKQRNYDIGYLGKWHISMPIKSYEGRKLTYNEGVWLSPEKRHGIGWWHIHTNNNHQHNTYVHYDKKPWETEKRDQWTVEYETDLALEYLKNDDNKYRDSNKPFSLIISYNPPHTPYNNVPKKYKDIYKTDDIETFCKDFPNIPPKNERWGKFYRNSIQGYYGAISGVDENVGRILKCLKEQGLEDNTIVIFTSDHGTCIGRHNKITKNVAYEESMRIPFIIKWPEMIKPRHDNLLISTADIYPTILELMGYKKDTPTDIDGTSYAPLFLGAKQKRPTSQIYMHIKEPEGNTKWGRRGVRTQTHTLFIEKWPAKNGETKNHVECYLFDRSKDPYQLDNLTKKQPEMVAKLIETELKPWMKDINDPFIVPPMEQLLK